MGFLKNLKRNNSLKSLSLHLLYLTCVRNLRTLCGAVDVFRDIRVVADALSLAAERVEATADAAVDLSTAVIASAR